MANDQCLQELLTGNQRFVSGQAQHPRQDAARREEVATGQHPKAIIITCSDSRLPPEIIFDQGLGDLFAVRTAGQVVDDAALASIEYAVEHLGAELIVVLGHKRCGAVQAAVDGGETRGHLNALIDKIKPAVEQAKTMPGDLIDSAVKNNIALTVNQLKTSAPVLSEAVKTNQLQIIGAYYDLDAGVISVLD